MRISENGKFLWGATMCLLMFTIFVIGTLISPFRRLVSFDQKVRKSGLKIAGWPFTYMITYLLDTYCDHGIYYLFLLFGSQEAARVLQPMLMGLLIRYFSPGSDVTARDAYLLASGISACTIFPLVTHHPYYYQATRMGMWLRVALCSLIYQKVIFSWMF